MNNLAQWNKGFKFIKQNCTRVSIKSLSRDFPRPNKKKKTLEVKEMHIYVSPQESKSSEFTIV